MDFRRKQERHFNPFTIDGAPVEWLPSFRYLGACIMGDLTWKMHSSDLVRKTCQCIHFLTSADQLTPVPLQHIQLIIVPRQSTSVFQKGHHHPRAQETPPTMSKHLLPGCTSSFKVSEFYLSHTQLYSLQGIVKFIIT